MKSLYSFLLIFFFEINLAFAVDPTVASASEASQYPYLFLLLFVASAIFFLLTRTSISSEEPPEQSFMVITPYRAPKYFFLTEEIINMEPVVEALSDKDIHVYSNLSKINLSFKHNSVLVEDKNFKNSILINRRRSRRTVLQHGDIIDMGELTMMYLNPSQKGKKGNPKYENKGIPKTNRMLGKILSNNPSLIPDDQRKKTFYLSKNISYIGRSETNDLVTSAKSVSAKHAKIERVSGRHKLVDLNSENGTFVNGRRVEEIYLKDGDEISFDSARYRFSRTGKSRL